MTKNIQKIYFLCTLLLMQSTLMLQVQSQNPVGAIPGVIDVSPMGAATYTVPIDVVPGTQGMQPNLSIVYNSFGGMGILGMKWSLSGLSAITRCGQTPYYDKNIETIKFNNGDKFAIDGNRLLCMDKGNYGADGMVYATEVENFTRIVSTGGGANGPPDYFTAYTDDGTIIEYGNTEDSKQQLGEYSYSILGWYVSKITDFNGNYMTFHYEPYYNGEIRLDEIRYTGNVAAGISTYAKVKFYYKLLQEELGQNTCYVSGYGITQTFLLDNIVVSFKDTVVRKYEFKYNEGVSGERSAHLKKIILHNGNNEHYNETVIKWGDNYSNLMQQSITGIPANFPNGKFLTGDFNGDGYVDLLVYDVTWSGGKSWDVYLYNPLNNTYEKKSGGIYTSLSNDNLFYAQDINGDGKDEIIYAVKKYSNTQGDYYHEVNFCKMTGSALWPTQSIPDFYNIIFGDFNGDGITDYFIVTGKITHTLLEGYKIKYSIIGYGNISYEQKILGNEFEPLYINVIDYNGNGKQDLIVSFFSKRNLYELNGSNFSLITNYSYPPFSYHPECLFYGDVNGDGITDILQFSSNPNPGYWKLFLASGDGTYLETNLGTKLDTWSGPSNTGRPVYKVRFADLTGDGKEDIIQGVYNSNTNTTTFNILISKGCVDGEYKYSKKTISVSGNYASLENWSIGDYNGDGKQEIILYNNSEKLKVIYISQDDNYEFVKEIDDGLGKIIKLSYEPIYFIAQSRHKSNTSPQYNTSTERKYFLPLLKSIQSSNGIGTGLNTIQYQYNTPAYSLPKRAFLGFNEFICINNLENKRDEFVCNFNNYGSSILIYDRDIQLLIPSIKASYYSNKKTVQIESPGSVEYLLNNRFIYKSGDEVVNYLENTLTSTQNIVNNEGRVIRSITKTYNGTSYNPNNLLLSEEKQFFYKGICMPGHQQKTVPTKVVTTQQYLNSGDAVLDTLTLSYTSAGRLDWKQSSNKDGTIKTTYSNYTKAGLFGKVTVTAGNDSRYDTYSYDATQRFVTQIKNYYGHISKNYYDAKTGNKTKEIDPNGLSTTYKYDSFGSLTQINYPDKTQTNISVNWHTSSNPPNAKYFTTTTSSGKPDVKVFYDVLGREVCRHDDGYYFQTVYNNKGQVEKNSGPFDSFTSTDIKWHYYTYDIYGRKETEKALHLYLDLTYSYNDRKVTVTDNIRQISSFKNYDALGRITEAEDEGGAITYNYSVINQNDTLRHKTEITTMRVPTTIISDLRGNRISIKDPDAGLITSTYNGFNELTTQIDARDNKTTFQYDKLGRVTKKVFSAPGEKPQTISYTYDNTAIAGKGIGKLYQIQIDGVQTEIFFYDEYSRLKKHTKKIDKVFYDTRYKYDQNGQLETLTYPDGFAIKYKYSPTGKLQEIINNSDNSLIYKVVSRNKYNAPTRCDYGNNITSFYKYNDNGLLTRIQTGIKTTTHGGGIDPNAVDTSSTIYKPRGGGVLITIDVDSSILNYRYGYDNKGLMSSRSESVLGYSELFDYDNLDRLISITPKQGTPQMLFYQNNGNISSSPAGSYNYNSTDKPHAVRQIDQSTTTLPQTVTYNFFNQPTNIIERRQQLELYYGANQQRNKTVKLMNGRVESTQYYISKYFEAEKKSDSDSTRYYSYIYGDIGVVAMNISTFSKQANDSIIYEEPILDRGKASTVTNNMYYIHTDHLGSYCAITDTGKKVVQRNYFDAWGNYSLIYSGSDGGFSISDSILIDTLDTHLRRPTLNFTLTRRGFTGHEHYPEFSIINMNGRLYDPVIARFFSPDKYVMNSSFTQDFNRYTYARNNPLMYTDPNGEFLQVLVPILTAAVLGGLQGYMMGDAKGAKGWSMAGYIFGGAAISGASAAAGMGVGIAVGGALATAGVKGILGGAITGAVSGIVAGTISGLGMGLLTGKTGNDLWKSTWQGALIGMGSGMVMGATIGMLDALANNKNVWLGRDIAMGRNAWSLNNTDLPAKNYFAQGPTKNATALYDIEHTVMQDYATHQPNEKFIEKTTENWIISTPDNGYGCPAAKRICVIKMQGRGYLDYKGWVPEGHQVLINFDGKNVLTLSSGNYVTTNTIPIPSNTQYIDVFYTGNYPSDWHGVITNAPFRTLIRGIWRP